MKQLFIYVEGQTEETFVRNMLSPHLQRHQIYPIPILAKTKRTKAGLSFKGGITSYGKVKREVKELLRSPQIVAVTTMIDFYGLPNDFPGKLSIQGSNPFDRVKYLEEEMGRDINDKRFIPFLTLHEFEALLFTRPEEITSTFPHRQAARKLIGEAATYSTPEEIDEGPNTHPAQRIARVIPSYRKRIDGPRIAERIGLQNIRAKCPHFNQWVERLENL